MNEEIMEAELDATLLTRRARITMERGGSVERLLRDTDYEVLALMPLAVRTPDEVAGSCYGSVASGDLHPRLAIVRMDAACCIHTDYAYHWLQHAECEAFGMTPARIAGCEILDLIRHDWRDTGLTQPDALDAVA